MDADYPDQTLALIFARNAFYKRLHYLALLALFLASIIIILLLILLLYVWRNPTHPLYFPSDPVSRLIRVVPVDVPNMSTPDVTAWTVEAVQATFSYDYLNYHAQLQNAQKYFTNYGWRNYMKALTQSNDLFGIIQNKSIAIAQVSGAPRIVKQGILAGAFAWKFDMPMVITFMQPPYDGSDKSQYNVPYDVTVLVQRQSVLQGYQGLGIVQLIATLTSSQAQAVPEITTSPGDEQ